MNSDFTGAGGLFKLMLFRAAGPFGEKRFYYILVYGL